MRPAAGGPYRVLVAAGEEIERRSLRRILGGGGLFELDILEAANGREALALAGEGRLDAAFLDLCLPSLGGIEAARRLREAQPDLPLVLMTASDSFDCARSAVRLHVEDLLLKPVSSDEVRDALRRSLAGVRRGEGAAGDTPLAETRLKGLVAYMAGELRAGLAAGDMESEGFLRYAEVVGGVANISAVLALKVEVDDPIEFRQASLRSAAALAERRLGNRSRVVLAGAGAERVLCALASTGEDERRLRLDLATLLEAARSELGVHLIAGAALATAPQAAEGAASHPRNAPTLKALTQTALRSLVLAHALRPLVIVPVAQALQSAEPPIAPARGDASGAVRRALELMEARYADDISLDAVAAEFGVSPSHLSRLLGRQAGIGFADCLARLRVEKSKAFLASGRTSVKEAALMVGFRDPAYFARVFRRFCRMSPAEYRSGRANAREGAPG